MFGEKFALPIVISIITSDRIIEGNPLYNAEVYSHLIILSKTQLMEIVTNHKPPYGSTDNEDRNVNAAIEETKECGMSWGSYYYDYEYYDYLI